MKREFFFTLSDLFKVEAEMRDNQHDRARLQKLAMRRIETWDYLSDEFDRTIDAAVAKALESGVHTRCSSVLNGGTHDWDDSYGDCTKELSSCRVCGLTVRNANFESW